MNAAASPMFGPGPDDVRGVNRAIAWSLAVHIGVFVILLVVPREWFMKSTEKKNVMTITLGGTAGPKSTGTTSIGSKTVEQAAPPPRRPEPVVPLKAPPVSAAVVKSTPAPPKAAETPQPTAKPPVEAVRPPVSGPQVNQGNTRVDTGATTGQGTGLTFGGGGGDGETDLKDFCCQEYLTDLKAVITNNWRKDQPERGTTVVKFTIRRDGTIVDPIVEKPSGNQLLDREARNAVIYSRFDPLPAEYNRDTLVIHLTFPYNGTPR